MLLKTTLSMTAVTAALLGPTVLTPRAESRQDDETATKLVAELEAIRIAQDDAAKAAEEALRRAEVERAQLETDLAALAAQEAAMQEALNREKMEEDRRFADQKRLLAELKDREAQMIDRETAFRDRLLVNEAEMAERREVITQLELERGIAKDEILELKARFDTRMQDEQGKRRAAEDEEQMKRLEAERAAYEAMVRDLEVRLKDVQREVDVNSLIEASRRQAMEVKEQAEVARRLAEVAAKQEQYEAVKRFHEMEAKRTWRETALAKPATPSAPRPGSKAKPATPTAPRVGSFALPAAPAKPGASKAPKTINAGDGVTIIVEQGDVHVHMNGSEAPRIGTMLPPATGGLKLPPAPTLPAGVPAAEPSGSRTPWPLLPQPPTAPQDPKLLPEACEGVAGGLAIDRLAVADDLFTEAVLLEVSATPRHAEIVSGALLAEIANVNVATNDVIGALLVDEALNAASNTLVADVLLAEESVLRPTLIATAEAPDASSFPLAGNLVVGSELIGYVGNDVAANEAQAAVEEIHAMMEALRRDLSDLQSLVETLRAELDR